MLSLKTSLSQGATGSGHPTFHNQPKHTKLPTLAGGEASATMPPANLAGAAVVEDDEGVDQVVSSSSCATSGSSYESLVDSMRSSSSTATSTSSMHSSHSSSVGACHGLMKRSSMNKSSYALTSLLAQQQPQELDQETPTEGGNHNNSLGSATTTATTVPTSLASAIAAEARAMKPICPKEFGQTLQSAINQGGTDNNNNNLNFHNNRYIRQALELPLRQARSLRDSCRRGGGGSSLFDVGSSGRSSFTTNHHHVDQLPLSSWVGLPYASLRQELPFLYDHMHTHPLNELLATTLGVEAEDLSQLHQGWDPRKESARDHQRRIFAPLVHDRQRRRAFQEAYDSFVTSCCLPLLHATALRGGVFNSNSSNRQHPTVLRNDQVLYRYQVFPTINVIYPNDLEACQPPSCDLSSGKSVGWLHFHIPLTASQGTSALYCEHFPGREDWHALRCSQVGLGYCWDGARCLSFVPLNTTGATRVSLDFRILLVRASTAAAVAATTTTTEARSMPSLSSRSSSFMGGGGGLEDDTLCRTEHLQDALTRVSGFYKEATMDSFASTAASAATGDSCGGTTLVEPDARCGFPFA